MNKLQSKGKVTEESVMTIPSSFRKEILEAYKGRSFKITIEEDVAIRSILFNSFYWVAIMKNATAGFIQIDPIQRAEVTTADVHKFFKRKYLFNGIRHINKTTGETAWLKEPTTTTLDNSEFIKYCKQIIEFCLVFLNTDIDEKAAEYYYSTLEEPKQWKDLSHSQLKKVT